MSTDTVAEATTPTDDQLADELAQLADQLREEGWTPPERPRNVIEALAAVMSELPGIGRDQESEQGYQYRGIEAITKHAQQLLGRFCVVFVPKVLRREVKDLTINNRPWTEDHAEVIYTVYGPGGIEDKIEVGPLWGLGRDNSDKGMNKAMTQAFKYALLQTLCIGDHKDDSDREEAHVADARRAEVDPDRQVRIDLGNRIRGLAPEQRDTVRAFCDDHGIPRVTAQMDDEQVEAVSEKVDALVIAAEQDAAAEASQAPPSTPDSDEEPSGDDTTPDAAEDDDEPENVADEPSEDEAEEDPAVRAFQEAIAQPSSHQLDEWRAEVEAEVAAIEDVHDLNRKLRVLDETIMGSEEDRRQRLVAAMVAQRVRQHVADHQP
jgi:hypothetical protein